MERVYTTQDLAMLSHLKNSLAAQGIECVFARSASARRRGRVAPD